MIEVKTKNLTLSPFQKDVLPAIINKLNKILIYKKFYYDYYQDKKNNIILFFVPIEAEGFEIEIFISKDDIYFKLDEWGDMTCDLSDKSDKIKLDNFLNFFEKLKNHKIKFVKYYSNNSPYKWKCFEKIDNEWKSLGRLNDLIYNYFGKKTLKEFFL